MDTVTATEFQRRPGEYQHRVVSRRTSLTITSHGRPQVVLVPVDEYERLKRRDREAFLTSELPEEIVQAIAATRMDPRHDHLDAELDDT